MWNYVVWASLSELLWHGWLGLAETELVTNNMWKHLHDCGTVWPLLVPADLYSETFYASRLFTVTVTSRRTAVSLLACHGPVVHIHEDNACKSCSSDMMLLYEMRKWISGTRMRQTQGTNIDNYVMSTIIPHGWAVVKWSMWGLLKPAQIIVTAWLKQLHVHLV